MKKAFFNLTWSIRAKTSFFVLFLLALTITASYLVMVRMMQERILNEVMKRGESLCRSIASAASYNFINQDILGLDTLVFKVRESNPDIDNIAIIDNDNNIQVHSDVDLTGESFVPFAGDIIDSLPDGTAIKEIGGPRGGFFEIESPIVFMDKPLGKVVLNINKSVLSTAQEKMRQKISLVFLIILLIGMASTVLLSSFLTRPVKELSKGVEELKEGKVSKPLRVYSRDEMGRLTESFNEMSARITQHENELKRYAHDLEESYVATVKVLSAAIDARDNYTLGHSTRVARLSVELAEKMGFSKEELEELEIACLFHDVGKMKIPDSILHKDKTLVEEEASEMRRHSEYGAEILTKAPSLLKYIPVVRHHHEWYNGSGYPDGLRGDEIPLAAAITSLADVFDALTTDRPYRPGLSREKALREIQKLSGTQFSPKLVKLFVKMLRKK